MNYVTNKPNLIKTEVSFGELRVALLARVGCRSVEKLSFHLPEDRPASFGNSVFVKWRDCDTIPATVSGTGKTIL